MPDEGTPGGAAPIAGSGTTPPATPGVNSGQAAGGISSEVMDKVQSQLDGIQALVGKWGNEVGEIRQFKERIAALEPILAKIAGSSTGTQTPPATPSTPPLTVKPQELVQTMTQDEKAKVGDAWKKLDADKRKAVLAEVKGVSPSEKLVNAQAFLLTQLRENTDFVPDDLFATGEASGAPAVKTEGAGDIRMSVLTALGIADKSKNHAPPAGTRGDAPGTGRQSGIYLPNGKGENTIAQQRGGTLLAMIGEEPGQAAAPVKQ